MTRSLLNLPIPGVTCLMPNSGVILEGEVDDDDIVRWEDMIDLWNVFENLAKGRMSILL